MLEDAGIRFRSTFSSLISPQILTFWVVMIVVAAVAGPFGTFSAMGLGERLLYWAVIVSTSMVLGYLSYGVARMFWACDRLITQSVMAAALGTVLVAGDVWFLTPTNYWGSLVRPRFDVLVSYAALILGAVALLRYYWKTMGAEVPVLVQPELPKEVTPRLVRRLPETQGGDVLHLSVRDHFIEVTTVGGTSSIRMRFRDALDELDGVLGLRVHRSHWVATAAIQEVERDQARLFIKLVNGTRVPVSRNYRPVLEDAGLL